MEGGACTIWLSGRPRAGKSTLGAMLVSELAARGLRVLRNQPYAGGFTTQRYGRPGLARHALQIEINRALYMDETRHERLPVAGVVERLMAGLLEEIGNQALEILLPRPLAAE